MSQYPIIAEHKLGAVTSGLFRSARRDPRELPNHPASAQLVAVVDGAYERLPGQLRGNERVFVEASSIVVVDMDPYRHVEVELRLESRVEGELFVLRVTFSCAVKDALVAAEKAPRDIVPVLAGHLNGDAKLTSAGKQHTVGDVTALKAYANARVKALCSAKRPPAEGVRVTFTSIDIETPRSLIDHAEKKRREAQARELEQLRQELESMKDSFTFQQAGLLEEVLNRGPEAIQALALRLNERRYDNVSERAFDERQRREDRLLDLTMRLAEHGHFDTVPLETKRLIDKVVDSFVGPPSIGQGPGGEAPALGADAAGGAKHRLPDPAADDADADRPFDPPDEESLVG